MRNDKTRLSHDVPRPRDSVPECVARILQGQNHAVCDLIDALERDGDPRYEMLALKRDRMVSQVLSCPPGPSYATIVVSYWQDLAVWCVRVMLDPEIQKQVDQVKSAVGIKKLLL